MEHDNDRVEPHNLCYVPFVEDKSSKLEELRKLRFCRFSDAKLFKNNSEGGHETFLNDFFGKTPMKPFNFQDGLEETVNRIVLVERKPILVGIFGFPGSGKSFFMKKAYTELTKRELIGIGCPPDEEYILELPSYHVQYNVVLFHDHSPRLTIDFPLTIYIPGSLDSVCRKHFGKPVDINVGIYAPGITDTLNERDYDVFIENTAVVKR